MSEKEGEEIEEGQNRRAKRQKDADHDEDLLPESGLYTSNGHLFYHSAPIQLSEAMYKRAEEQGINLRSLANFSAEETVQIFRNWHDFSKNTDIATGKVLEYLQAKQKTTHGHIVKHQEKNQFWPKFCHGLPHRSCQRIKGRAVATMTDDFIEVINDDWSSENLIKKIQERFFKNEKYDDAAMQKMTTLLEKRSSVAEAGKTLGLPVVKAKNIAAKSRKEQYREEQEMLGRVYETAIYFGLSTSKIQKCVIDDNDDDIFRLRRDVDIEQLSLQMNLSPGRCKDLLQTTLLQILNSFRHAKGEGFTDDEAWSEAIGEFSPKLPIREEQTVNALEVFCHHVTKKSTIFSLKDDVQLKKKLKSEGITGFRCDSSETNCLLNRVNKWIIPMDENVFRNLRREVRAQVKLHCLLWAIKRMEVWEKLKVDEGKTRYETILESEVANPLASKMTMKFLKNEQVCEWIMEPRPETTRRNAATLRLETIVEAFILYTFQKFGGEFKFPAKFRHLVAETTSATIRNLVEQISDVENIEYWTKKEVRETVENASGKKISAKVRSKGIATRKDMDSGEDSDDVENPVSVKHLKDQRSMESMKEITNTPEKAGPSKRRKKLRKFKSKEYVFTSDDDSSDDDDRKKKEDVTDSENELRKKDKKKKKKEKHRESEVLESGKLEESEDVTDSKATLEKQKKKKKRKRQDSEAAADDVVESEVVGRSKKHKKKRKRRDSEDLVAHE